MKNIVGAFIALVFLSASCFAESGEYASALEAVKTSCGGIESELNRMKTMAGINTAVTGAGTLAGGGAIAVGFIKEAKDKEAVESKAKLDKLREIEKALNPPGELTSIQKAAFEAAFVSYRDTAIAAQEAADKEQAKFDKLDDQSKKLGDWRSGLMIGNTATNIAGAAIAGTNKIKDDLVGRINGCKESVAALDRAAAQARLDGVDVGKADKIIRECNAWNHVDLSKINSRADTAMVAAIVGALAGGVGSATSIAANTNDMRNKEENDGLEKKLNTASNFLAIGATGASAVAVGFNAAQISAINKAWEAAKICEEAL
jgi:hypothetical protein